VSDRLAIDGGTPVRSVPMPAWPAPDAQAVAAVSEVVSSGRINYWTGDQGRTLEREYAEMTGRAHGIALANGTLALESALRALGIGPGHEVVVPARTFIATASAVVAVGATPIVADIDRDSGNLTAATVEAVLSDKTRAVIPVHLGGWPVDMAPLMELARTNDLKVIEDCAQAHGARYHGRPVGALGSHAAAFSFCQDKIVPGGEGGVLVLDDEAAFRFAWEHKDHGKSLDKLEDPAFMGTPAAFRFVADSFGTNWRLDEMAAALALAGTRRLPEWHEARTTNALLLAGLLADLPGLRVPLPPLGVEHGFYRLYAYVAPETLSPGWDRDRILFAINAEGTPVQYGSCAEIYREAAFAKAGLGPAAPLPVAAELHDTSLAFFVHPTLTEADIRDTGRAIRKVLEAATR